jgi:hypothetical protein
MLANPDIAQSASINHWIISILVFHFTLIHIPSSFHGPDGLSRCKLQPGNQPEPEDNFDNWIDCLHGFIHIINLPTELLVHQPPITIYIAESNETSLALANDIDDSSSVINDIADETPAQPLNHDMEYLMVLRSDAAQKDDEHILKVCKWHDDLLQPPDLSDSQYDTFLCYCTEFFISSDCLWCKDSCGKHKLIIPPMWRLFILATTHDQVGHHEFFATNANISL